MRRVLATSAVLAALAIAGCGGSSAGPELDFANPPAADGAPQRGGTLELSVPTDVGSWDPLQGFESHTSVTLQPLVSEGLAAPARDFKSVVPALAAEITHNDGYTEWTVRLRAGARFSDGEPVTAADVVFSFERIAADPQWRYLLGRLARIEALDGRTVRFHLAAPNTEFDLLALATPQSGIVPAGFGGASEREFASHPVGAGPFVVESWQPGQRIVLRRNRLYWSRELPRLDGIEISIQRDDNARLLDLQSGQIQVADVLAQGAQAIAGGDTVIRGVKPSAVTDVLYLGSNTPLLADVDVRRAIWYAIDRAPIAAGVYRGGAEPAQGLIPPGTYGQAPGKIRPEYDLARARRLLAGSEHPEGGSMVITRIIGDQIGGTAAEAIADQLGEIGIEAKVRGISFAEFSELANQPESEMQGAFYGYSATVIPASDVLGYFVATNGFNGGYPVGPTQRTYEALQATASEAEAKQLTSGWEDYLARNAFAVPVVQPYWIVGQRPEVQGLFAFPNGVLDLKAAWLRP